MWVTVWYFNTFLSVLKRIWSIGLRIWSHQLIKAETVGCDKQTSFVSELWFTVSVRTVCRFVKRLKKHWFQFCQRRFLKDLKSLKLNPVNLQGPLLFYIPDKVCQHHKFGLKTESFNKPMVFNGINQCVHYVSAQTLSDMSAETKAGPDSCPALNVLIWDLCVFVF